MKSIYHSLFIVFCLLVLSNFAFSSESQLTIGSVQTAGNRSLSEQEILSKVRSRVGQVFTPAVAAEDAKRIAELTGVEYSYYNTAVVDGEIQLTFVVVEREVVKSIDFVGNRSYKEASLRKKLPPALTRGGYFNPIMAEASRKALEGFYQKNGYAFVRVVLDVGQLSAGRLVYTIEEGLRVKIKSVKFSGNKAIKTRKLKRSVKTKRKKFFILASYYVKDKVDADVAKLQEVYYQRGFLNSRITIERQFNADKSGVSLVFVIDEGPVYAVERIVFAGNEHFERKELEAGLKLGVGQVYKERKAESDVKKLLKLYREKGFVDAKVGHSIKFVSESSVDVEFGISEGERFRIGRINITGNEQTKDKVVRRVLDEYDFQPGQWYNAHIARGDGNGYLEKLVRRTALTESATITPSGEAPGQRDAQVSVVEGQTGMVMIGAGVGSDSGVVGQLVFEQRNFDISDKPESFGEFITGQAFKGAGQSFRISLQPGTEVSEYTVSFGEPYFQDKPISLDVAGSSYERWLESYNEGRTRGYVGFERRYKNRWRKSINFRLENVEVDSLDTDAPREIIDVKGDNILAGIRVGIGRNLTDDEFNPSTGYIFNTGYEQFSGDHTFGVLSGTYRRYITLYEDLAEQKTILGAKLHAATTVGDAPPFEKFYAGGQGSIRGFDYRGVSTRGLQTNVANPKRKDPIGSDWIFLANTEVVVPLVSENFAALFFVDSGAIDTGNYRAAIGAGIQILVPQWFGPVPMRFEFSAPLMKDDEDETQTFSFSVGRLF